MKRGLYQCFGGASTTTEDIVHVHTSGLIVKMLANPKTLNPQPLNPKAVHAPAEVDLKQMQASTVDFDPISEPMLG